MKQMGHPIEHFAVPIVGRPEPVEAASAKFEETTAAFQAARAKHQRLLTSRHDDIREATLAQAQARVDGRPKPTLTPAKIDQNIAEAEAEVRILSEATDLAHTALVEAVAEHKEAWLEQLVEADAAATERLRLAIDAASEAVAALQVARTAPAWLADFYVGASQGQWHGGKRLFKAEAALSQLAAVVTPAQRLIAYSDDGPVYEDVVVGQEKMKRVLGSPA